MVRAASLVALLACRSYVEPERATIHDGYGACTPGFFTGRVVEANGDAVAGATIVLSGDSEDTQISNEHGSFAIPIKGVRTKVTVFLFGEEAAIDRTIKPSDCPSPVLIRWRGGPITIE